MRLILFLILNLVFIPTRILFALEDTPEVAAATAYYQARFGSDDAAVTKLATDAKAIADQYKSLKDGLKPTYEKVQVLQELSGSPFAFSSSGMASADGYFSLLLSEIEGGNSKLHSQRTRQEAVYKLSLLVEGFQKAVEDRDAKIAQLVAMPKSAGELLSNKDKNTKSFSDLSASIAKEIVSLELRSETFESQFITVIKNAGNRVNDLKTQFDESVKLIEDGKIVDESLNLSRAYRAIGIDSNFIEIPIAYLVQKSGDREIRANALKALARVKATNMLPLAGQDANLLVRTYLKTIVTEDKIAVSELAKLEELAINGPTDFAKLAALTSIDKVSREGENDATSQVTKSYQRIYSQLGPEDEHLELKKRVLLRELGELISDF